jgi:NAD(P)-dependent dehydrogenase (short-subunit alcohol dehydrogenase family)
LNGERNTFRSLGCLDIVADISKKSDVELMVEKIIQWKGTLDIAVNNAGRI